jgi:hypothetical protein
MSALRPITMSISDKTINSRLTKNLTVLKKLDLTSERGMRNPLLSLDTADGKSVLKDFEFNAKSSLSNVLHKPHKFNELSGQVKIMGMTPKVHLSYPMGASHVMFQSSLAVIDLTTGDSEILQSNAVELPINNTATNVELDIDETSTISGLKLYIFQIIFLQEMNGGMYPLNNKTYNTSKIISVL